MQLFVLIYDVWFWFDLGFVVCDVWHVTCFDVSCVVLMCGIVSLLCLGRCLVWLLVSVILYLMSDVVCFDTFLFPILTFCVFVCVDTGKPCLT